jgi:hypothetical protein
LAHALDQRVAVSRRQQWRVVPAERFGQGIVAVTACSAAGFWAAHSASGRAGIAGAARRSRGSRTHPAYEDEPADLLRMGCGKGQARRLPMGFR